MPEIQKKKKHFMPCLLRSTNLFSQLDVFCKHDYHLYSPLWKHCIYMDGSYGLHMVMHLCCQPMLCNPAFQWCRTYRLWPNCRIVSITKEIHDISFSLTIDLKLHFFIILIHVFRHATLIMHGLPNISHTNGWYNSLGYTVDWLSNVLHLYFALLEYNL